MAVEFIIHKLGSHILYEYHNIIVYEGNYEYYTSKKEEYEKKKSAKVDYDSIRDEIRRLECEIAYISGRLGD